MQTSITRGYFPLWKGIYVHRDADKSWICWDPRSWHLTGFWVSVPMRTEPAVRSSLCSRMGYNTPDWATGFTPRLPKEHKARGSFLGALCFTQLGWRFRQAEPYAVNCINDNFLFFCTQASYRVIQAHTVLTGWLNIGDTLLLKDSSWQLRLYVGSRIPGPCPGACHGRVIASGQGETSCYPHSFFPVPLLLWKEHTPNTSLIRAHRDLHLPDIGAMTLPKAALFPSLL